MSASSYCPRCGARLTADAPHGLCPKCLIAAAMEGDSETGAPQRHSSAPTTPHSPAFLPPEASALRPLFPHLEILELLGHGGMGAVYKARQPKLDRLVALKVIRPESASDPAFAERFNREARLLARLSHPNIVAVYDFGEVAVPPVGAEPPGERRLYFFLMEYVEGANLRQLMHGGGFSPEQGLAIVPQLCDALQFAHDEGVVHRDIKPENILLDARGRVKIADFGLAKLVGPAEDFGLTATHQVMGTPRYMAPEQMEGSHSVDHRADIYSLGVVFYEMLTGEVPAGHFDPPSKKVEIDVRLDEVVLRTLAREPERRYQHASDVKTDVESISRNMRARIATAPREQSGQVKTGLESSESRRDEREPFGHASSKSDFEDFLLMNPRLSMTARWITVHAIVVRPVLWILVMWLVVLSLMSSLASDHVETGIEHAVDVAGGICGLLLVVIVAIGGVKLRGLRQDGPRLIKIGLGLGLGYGLLMLIMHLTFVPWFVGPLRWAARNNPDLLSTEGFTQGEIADLVADKTDPILISDAISMLLMLSWLALDIAVFVWLWRNSRFLPLSGAMALLEPKPVEAAPAGPSGAEPRVNDAMKAAKREVPTSRERPPFGFGFMIAGLFALGWLAIGILRHFGWAGFLLGVLAMGAATYGVLRWRLLYLPELRAELARQSRSARVISVAVGAIFFLLGMLALNRFVADAWDTYYFSAHSLQPSGAVWDYQFGSGTPKEKQIAIPDTKPNSDDANSLTIESIDDHTRLHQPLRVPFLGGAPYGVAGVLLLLASVATVLGTRAYQYSWALHLRPALYLLTVLLLMLPVVIALNSAAPAVLGFGRFWWGAIAPVSLCVESDITEELVPVIDSWAKRHRYVGNINRGATGAASHGDSGWSIERGDWDDSYDLEYRPWDLNGRSALDRCQFIWGGIVRPRPPITITWLKQTLGRVDQEPLVQTIVLAEFPWASDAELELWRPLMDSLREAMSRAASPDGGAGSGGTLTGDSDAVVLVVAVLFMAIMAATVVVYGLWTRSASAEPIVAPRFSRNAILGACAVALFVAGPIIGIVAFVVLWEMQTEPSNSGVAVNGLGTGDIALAVAAAIALAIVLIAPFAATILGIVAMREIKDSEGRLVGLGLAFFDAVFFPVVLISGVILAVGFLPAAYVARLVGTDEEATSVLLPLLFVAFPVNVLLVRWWWRAVKQGSPVGPGGRDQQVDVLKNEIAANSQGAKPENHGMSPSHPQADDASVEASNSHGRYRSVPLLALLLAVIGATASFLPWAELITGGLRFFPVAGWKWWQGLLSTFSFVAVIVIVLTTLPARDILWRSTAYIVSGLLVIVSTGSYLLQIQLGTLPVMPFIEAAGKEMAMGRIPTTTGESLHIYNIGPGAYIAMFAAIALGVLGAAEIAMRLQRTRTEADGEEKSIPAEAATYSDPGGIYSQPAQGIRQAAEIKADVESVPVPATPPRGTLGRAWDDWWGEREKWLTSIVQSALAIAFLVCFFMYLSSHSSSEPLQVAGAKKVRSTTTFGWPGPWLIYETYPSDNTPFRWKINWFSSSTAVMLAGYLAGCMNWQIEKAKAKAKGTVLRWWYGSPLALMGLWAVATFGCVAVVIGMMVMMN